MSAFSSIILFFILLYHKQQYKSSAMSYSEDEIYMKLAIQEALKGEGKTLPNPLVGCVITKNNEVVATGYHAKFGDDHAEIMAIKNANEDLKGACMYVTLEPCAHYGKTPPCVEAIISSGISRVVIGMRDPHDVVNGKGIEALIQAGLDVVEGVLREHVARINVQYLTIVQKNRPWFACKVAETIDGCIADYDDNSQWITSEESRNAGHVLRKQYDSIIVGANTVLLDNPHLTCRIDNYPNPVRVVIDPQVKTRPDMNVYKLDSHDRKQPVLIYNPATPNNIEIFQASDVVTIAGEFDGLLLRQDWLCQCMLHMEMYSALVEGGAHTWASFLQGGLVDEMYFFIAPIILGSTKRAITLNSIPLKDAIKLRQISRVHIGEEMLIHGYLTDLIT
jgi:diaminohydroxyphosphoribosylaminopyrimidine deaminase/5-amino-6-(5-phosphoribosylamino)uracil reductase